MTVWHGIRSVSYTHLDVYKRQVHILENREYTGCLVNFKTEKPSYKTKHSVETVSYTHLYLRLYSGTLRLRDTVALAGREKLKITEMRIPSKGEIVRTDTALSLIHILFTGRITTAAP